MANWCNNIIAFEGSPEAIEQIRQLFSKMAEQERNEGCGQLPDFVSADNGGYFFAIYQSESDTGTFQYETKWSPNIEVVQQLAVHYEVDFVMEYEELSCWVYGQATYRDGILNDICLDSEDFETFHFDEETCMYFFEDETYESDYEILDTLLERKTIKELSITIND